MTGPVSDCSSSGKKQWYKSKIGPVAFFQSSLKVLLRVCYSNLSNFKRIKPCCKSNFHLLFSYSFMKKLSLGQGTRQLFFWRRGHWSVFGVIYIHLFMYSSSNLCMKQKWLIRWKRRGKWGSFLQAKKRWSPFAPIIHYPKFTLFVGNPLFLLVLGDILKILFAWGRNCATWKL